MFLEWLRINHSRVFPQEGFLLHYKNKDCSVQLNKEEVRYVYGLTCDTMVNFGRKGKELKR